MVSFFTSSHEVTVGALVDEQALVGLEVAGSEKSTTLARSSVIVTCDRTMS